MMLKLAVFVGSAGMWLGVEESQTSSTIQWSGLTSCGLLSLL